MKSLHFITFLILMISIAGCLPDSLTKWNAEEPKNVLTPSTVSIQVDGKEVKVGEASGGTPPKSIQLSAEVGSRELQTISSDNEVNKNHLRVTLNESFSIKPSFVDETGASNNYYFSLNEINSSDEKIRFDASSFGLSFDSKTGILSGVPEKFIPSKKLSLGAYHVESGTWLSIPFNFVAATSFTSENAKVYYPISKDFDSYYIVEVDDIKSFTLCKSSNSSSTCITSDNDIRAYVEHIDEDEKKLFLKITNTLAAKLPEHETLEDAKTLDNSNDFVGSDANVVSVTRIFKRCTGSDNSCARKLVPKFNFQLASADNELGSLEWSITPIPFGGIAENNSTFIEHIGFIEESSGEDSGSIIIPNKANEIPSKEFTIKVKNELGETLATKINLSISQAPSNLGVGNLYLITLDSNEEFRIGNYISSNNETKAHGKIIDKIGTNKIAIQILNGDFNPGDQVDILKKFSRKRAVVLYKTLFNAILTIDDSLVATSLNVNDPENNEYRNIISQDHVLPSVAHPQDKPFSSHAVIKDYKSNISTLTVYGGAHQFSPGLQIVQMGEGSTCSNGDGVATTGAVGTIISISRNPYSGNGDKNDFDQIIYVNVLSGAFQPNKPIQIGGSEYDCTTTSVDLVETVINDVDISQIYVLIPEDKEFSISNPNEIVDEIKINTGTTNDKKLLSVWSPNISFKSINEAGKWYVGDDISTRSHIPGKINSILPFTEIKAPLSKWHPSTPGISGQDEVGQIITAEFNQTGFLFASFDTCDDVDFFNSSDCRSNSSLLTDRNAGRGDQGDGDPEFIFSKGNIYNVNSVMNMSSYNVTNKNFEDNGNILEGGNVEAPFRSRDDSQIKELKTTHQYTFYAREPMTLKSELQYGDDVIYSISPKLLPDGLSFNSKDGTLNGIPTEKLDLTNFTITARNPMGMAQATFSIEIKDHFSLTIPKEFSDAESYILHSAGQGNQATNCRITSDQIDGNNQSVKDILCYLEAGEMDLFFQGLELDFNVGPSMCEYIRFSPYTYTDNNENGFIYKKTGTIGRHKVGTTLNDIHTVEVKNNKWVKINRTYSYGDSCKICYVAEVQEYVNCSVLPTENNSVGEICESNYAAKLQDSEDIPNCDDGSYIDRTIRIGNDAFVVNADNEIKDGVCGGKANSGHTAFLEQITDDFTFGAIDFNNDGKLDANDDISDDQLPEILVGNGTFWNPTPAPFIISCANGVSDSNKYTYTSSSITTITFTVTQQTNSGDGSLCPSDNFGNSNAISTVTFDIIKLPFFKNGTIVFNGTSYTNNYNVNIEFAFMDTDGDDVQDSIILDGLGIVTCDDCVDADGDGKFDYVDFNGDSIADDLIDQTGNPGTDGWGDHTINNGVHVGRIDSEQTKTQNAGNEIINSCGGDPYQCLKGSNKLITSHQLNSNRQNLVVESIYGVEIGDHPLKFKSPNLADTNNYSLANYSRANSCGVNPLVIHQNSVFHDIENLHNYNQDSALGTFPQSGLGAGSPLYIEFIKDKIDDETPDSLSWEIDSSYKSEDFYKGLGDLLYDDLIDVCDEDDNGGGDCTNNSGSAPTQNDFSPSITLPYVYKKQFTNTADVAGIIGSSDMIEHPLLALAKKKSTSSSYEMVSIESIYDTNRDIQEVTFYESGFNNLTRLSKGQIWRMNSLNLPNQPKAVTGMTVEVFNNPVNDDNEIFRAVVLDIDISKKTIDLLVTYADENFDPLKVLDFYIEGTSKTPARTKIFSVDNSEYLPYRIGFDRYNLGNDLAPANPFYSLECLDAARDLKARIRLQVRDWDRVFTAGHDLDKTIPSSLMDDSSIDLWEEDFDNRSDGDTSGGNKLNNCLIDYPVKNRNYPFKILPSL